MAKGGTIHSRQVFGHISTWNLWGVRLWLQEWGQPRRSVNGPAVPLGCRQPLFSSVVITWKQLLFSWNTHFHATLFREHMGLWNVSTLGGKQEVERVLSSWVLFTERVQSRAGLAGKTNKMSHACFCFGWHLSTRTITGFGFRKVCRRWHRRGRRGFLFLSRRKFADSFRANLSCDEWTSLCWRQRREASAAGGLRGRKNNHQGECHCKQATALKVTWLQTLRTDNSRAWQTMWLSDLFSHVATAASKIPHLVAHESTGFCKSVIKCQWGCFFHQSPGDDGSGERQSWTEVVHLSTNGLPLVKHGSPAGLCLTARWDRDFQHNHSESCHSFPAPLLLTGHQPLFKDPREWAVKGDLFFQASDSCPDDVIHWNWAWVLWDSKGPDTWPSLQRNNHHL